MTSPLLKDSSVGWFLPSSDFPCTHLQSLCGEKLPPRGPGKGFREKHFRLDASGTDYCYFWAYLQSHRAYIFLLRVFNFLRATASFFGWAHQEIATNRKKCCSISQDAQKGRSARPQRVKTGGVPSGVR
jgi:hypothetical protein